MSDSASLTQAIKQHAKFLGFDLVGIAQPQPSQTFDHYKQWVEQGYFGEMTYMERNQEKRQDLRSIMPEAKSVIVVGWSYGKETPKSVLLSGLREEVGRSEILRGRVARYAWGEDYHEVLQRKLEELLEFIRRQVRENVQGKVCVDTAPLLERDIAVQAGLGWFGKNTNLLNQHFGSYFFLGELLLNIELEYDQPFARQQCGKCVRCLVGCPTDAFIAPYILDARRCISYLTIELKGNIPRQLRALIGAWVFGCDICQEVCPWNIKLKRTSQTRLSQAVETVEKDNHAVRVGEDLSARDLIDLVFELLSLDEKGFRRRFQKSPIKRVKRRGLLRNVCVTLGNLRASRAVPALTKALLECDEPLVRGHAAWALGQIPATAALSALQKALESEKDFQVRTEIEEALKEARMVDDSHKRYAVSYGTA